jgi:hypothetical protein
VNSYYTWNFGDGQSATGISVYHCYSVTSPTAQYSVTLAYVSPSCPNEPIQHVYTATLSALTATNCNFNPTVTVSAPSISITPFMGAIIPEITYEYGFGDGSPNTTTSTSQLIPHTYTACGNYIISVKMFDMHTPQSGCYTYTSVNIPCATTTGFEKNTPAIEAKLFPNPASQLLTVISDVPLQRAAIFDLMGREVAADRFTENNTTRAEMNVSHLTPGAYFLRLQTDKGAQKNIKFIKE